MEETVQRTSTIARFAQMEASEFQSEIDKGWNALADVKEVLSEQVANGNLTPVQGVAILACSTGQVFGYAEFHGLAGPADLALRASSGNGSSQVQRQQPR